MLIPGTTLIFHATTLITGTTLIKNGSPSPLPRLLRAPRLFGRQEHILFKRNINKNYKYEFNL